MPVYNEGNSIEHTLRSYYDELRGKIDFELIVMEDGSTDSTKSVLTKLERILPIKVYSGMTRKGYAKAIQDGIHYTHHDWVLLVDSDGQYASQDIWKLWSYTDRYDIILGKKTTRQDGILRLLLSRTYNFLLRLFFSVSFKDMDTGFRLVRKSILNNVGQKVSYLQFFNAEFVIRAYYKGARVVEVPIHHRKRVSGETRIFNITKIPRIVCIELVRIFRLFCELRL